jgi:aminoglycoside 6'-N-acetyltransferase I
VKESDSAEWLRMRRALFGDDGDQEPEVQAYFHSPKPAAPTFVAQRPSGALAAFIELSVRSYAEGCSGPVAYIEGWYVDRDVRRRGLGAALIKTAETWARAAGYREIGSDALLGNELSIRAHRALGYEEVCRVVCFRRSLAQ